MNKIELEVYNRYIDLGVRKCDICKNCEKTEKRFSGKIFDTTGIWCVGDNYPRLHQRILFVGKVARGDGGGVPYTEESKIYNVTKSARGYLWDNKGTSRAYWKYTKEICKRVFGDDSVENAAFTNIVKCNTSKDKDKTTYDTKISCIRELKVLRNEIDILNPSVIVFYTSQDYDEFIFGKDLFDDVSLVTEIENRKIIGAKRMPWTEAIGKKAEKNIDILRVGHPERMKKEDYVDSISSWIKEKGISE